MPSTVYHYAHDLKMFSRFVGGVTGVQAHSLPVRALNRTHVSAFLRHQMNWRKNGAASGRRRLACLRGFFRYLAAEGMMDENPALEVPFPEIDAKPPATFCEEEIERFRRALPDAAPDPRREAALFGLFIEAGARLSEALRLETPDVRLSDGEVDLRRSTGLARSVQISERLISDLREYIRHRPNLRGRLFLNRRAQPISKGAVYYAFEKILQAAGIERRGRTVHSLRHTCLVRMRADGTSDREVQELAGLLSRSSLRPYRVLDSGAGLVAQTPETYSVRSRPH